MAAFTIHSDFGAQENEICHCFHFSPSAAPNVNVWPKVLVKLIGFFHYSLQSKVEVNAPFLPLMASCSAGNLTYTVLKPLHLVFDLSDFFNIVHPVASYSPGLILALFCSLHFQI